MAKVSFEVVSSDAYLPYLLPPWLVLSVNQFPCGIQANGWVTRLLEHTPPMKRAAASSTSSRV